MTKENSLERKLFRTSPVHSTFQHYSYKNDCSMYLESHAERNLALILDASKDVISFISQPFSTWYVGKKGLCRYTPDFLVERLEKSTVTECKDASKPLNANELIKFEKIESHIISMGFDFKLQYVDFNSAYVSFLRKIKRYASAEPFHIFSAVPKYSGTVKNLFHLMNYDTLLMSSFYAAILYGLIEHDAETFVTVLEMYVVW